MFIKFRRFFNSRSRFSCIILKIWNILSLCWSHTLPQVYITKHYRRRNRLYYVALRRSFILHTPSHATSKLNRKCSFHYRSVFICKRIPTFIKSLPTHLFKKKLKQLCFDSEYVINKPLKRKYWASSSTCNATNPPETRNETFNTYLLNVTALLFFYWKWFISG